MISEGYLHMLGMENRYREASEAALADPVQAIALTEAFDRVGGAPGSINEYEQGCVIEDAPIPPMLQPTPTPTAQNYVELCSNALGDARWCSCTTERRDNRLSAQETEALLGFLVDVRTVDPDDRDQVNAERGARMGLSGVQYSALIERARSTYSPFEARDDNFCYAQTWADDNPGYDAETRLEAGFEPGSVGTLASETLSSPAALDPNADPVANAREIAARYCSQTGNGEAYCGCYMREFEARVVQASSPDVALAWALNFASDGIAVSERMTFAQTMPPAAMQQSAMLFASTADLGDSCPLTAQPDDETSSRLTGSPRDRLIQICIEDGADTAMCTCAVDRMEAQFPPADFELIVDIREADARGEDDPLAAVAAERGLTAAEAEEALQNNPAIMRGAMAMGQSMMQCMGGMPAMPNMPGGIPGMPGGGG
ncbi:MAG: hypothetical protein AAFX09_08635 [Pseudomonadota bacterium]